MATAVVSGRVDALIKQQADAVLAENGVTANEVIGSLWNQIAAERVIPIIMNEDELLEHRRKRFKEFEAWLAEQPPCRTLAGASDEDLKEMIYEGLVEKYG